MLRPRPRSGREQAPGTCAELPSLRAAPCSHLSFQTHLLVKVLEEKGGVSHAFNLHPGVPSLPLGRCPSCALGDRTVPWSEAELHGGKYAAHQAFILSHEALSASQFGMMGLG